jgi:uncharacterized protein YukE
MGEAFVPGEPAGLREGATGCEALAYGMAELQTELAAALGRLGGDAWQGQASDAFSRHFRRRIQAVGTAEAAFRGMARVLEQFAVDLELAQEVYQQAQQRAASAGLRLSQGVVDPVSLAERPTAVLEAAAVVTEASTVDSAGYVAVRDLSAEAPVYLAAPNGSVLATVRR